MGVVGFAGASHVDAGHAARLAAAGADRVIAAMAELPAAIATLARGGAAKPCVAMGA